MEANMRNTKIKIAKSFIEKKLTDKDPFDFKDLSEKLWMRRKEIEAFKDKLFDREGEKWKVKSDFYNDICVWKGFHEESSKDIDKVKEKYRSAFFEIQETGDWVGKLDEIKSLYKKLHWYFLPVYEDYMIENREVSPEDDIDEYYNHYHSLQDLYKLLDRQSNYWKTLKGDGNLDKSCDFPVYTNRWGHEDVYKVTRLYNGWQVEFHNIGGFCTPDGKGVTTALPGQSQNTRGGFVANFNQDYVNYPKNFHNVIERLWNLADSNEMTIDELQEKLKDVARLVSEVERAVGEYTPSWY